MYAWVRAVSSSSLSLTGGCGVYGFVEVFVKGRPLFLKLFLQHTDFQAPQLPWLPWDLAFGLFTGHFMLP